MKKKITFIIVLCLTLSFNFIKVNSNSRESIPTGPLSYDKEVGIQQIMLAGVKDENFAEAIYDSLVKENYYGEASKNIREILGNFSGRIIANNKGIVNIEGIEWLRGASFINLGNRYDSPNANIKNKISDLTPLSFDYIKQIGNVHSDSEVYKWFKPKDLSEGNVVNIDLTGNPITKYDRCAGYLKLIISGELPQIHTESFNMIKVGGESKDTFIKKINLPILIKDGIEVKFSKTDSSNNIITTLLTNTTVPNAFINYEQLNNRTLEINNVNYSGFVDANVGVSDAHGIEFWKFFISSGQTESWGLDKISFQYSCHFNSRVYMPVYAENKIKTNVKVIKTEKDNKNRKIQNAKYMLYYDGDYKDKNKQNTLVSNQIYTTNKDGEFLLEELDEGNYYLMEVEAPKGYKLNQEKLKFSTEIDENIITVNGGDHNLNINHGDILEDANSVYIDRYSDDINLHYNEIQNGKLENLEIEYFDMNEQDYKIIKGENENSEFKSIEEVENWINANKGNSNHLGIIDGEVKIKAEYSLVKELHITNEKDKHTTVQTGDSTNSNVWIIVMLSMVAFMIYKKDFIRK